MSAGPELSSINTALEALTERITGLAESLSGTERDDAPCTTRTQLVRTIQSWACPLTRHQPVPMRWSSPSRRPTPATSRLTSAPALAARRDSSVTSA